MIFIIELPAETDYSFKNGIEIRNEKNLSIKQINRL